MACLQHILFAQLFTSEHYTARKEADMWTNVRSEELNVYKLDFNNIFTTLNAIVMMKG